jgi:CCR4-NOT complex subunit CAF16
LQIFDGLDEWATNLFYLTDSGKCGWQGKMQDLDVYQKLKADNHPAKMLAIAEHWLRAELIANRLLKKTEKASGTFTKDIDLLDRQQGGYASGRMETDEEQQVRMKRHGRLSDLKGNSGVLEKVHRTAGN